MSKSLTAPLNIAMAQCNFHVGDIPGNTAKAIEAAQQAAAEGADLIVFSELALTGYPPEDLLLRSSISHRVERALARIAKAAKETYIVVGYPRSQEQGLYNTAGVFYRGRLLHEYHKQCLPNYRVFDEKRYFKEGRESVVFDLFGVPTALSICEDIWQDGPTAAARAAGAQLMLNMSASPFHAGKQIEREALLAQRAWQGGMPIV